MPLAAATLARQLEELHLLKCSLMPDETLQFTSVSEDSDRWSQLLESYADNPDADAVNEQCEEPVRFTVKVNGLDIWVAAELSHAYNGEHIGDNYVSVTFKGSRLGRAEQAQWQAIIDEKTREIHDSEYPVYELISAHLLPFLHAEAEKVAHNEYPSETVREASSSTTSPTPLYHVLLTSHHLKSPNKRRSLQQWVHELPVTGFAKVGYPGVIYCSGEQPQVEEFAANVKAMQWLALKVRFVEPLPDAEHQAETNNRRRWTEFEKVGEVVEEMRRLGKERYVVEMGIGSAGGSTLKA
ncbi:hypothetical protein WOLCODRAFT_63598 [Wolfiporia cocos MD-104 SS10]|uniref:Uncharacterized protein n=1 Tax=Wolfiporia cocos (strain MD-104) TaxID=742152 RepID=A0A2H3JEE3_WOLCO|nr:hypothetical protein WOLCODRAFT_63598 [Wolfiporia cocos MD-104 SS10]